MKEKKYTPVILQYLEIKKDYADSLVLFRLGDFYELFFDDAVVASKILEIVLTKKTEDVPMCGIPYHAANTYIQKLIARGMKVAIVEQVGEVGKGLVERKVKRIITPGQIIDDEILDKKNNNFIASLTFLETGYDLCYIDISTGETFVDLGLSIDEVKYLLLELNIKEIILSSNFDKELVFFIEKNNILVNYYYVFDPIMVSLTKDIYGIHKKSCYLILNYLNNTQKHLNHLMEFKVIDKKNSLYIEPSTKVQLEIFLSNTNNPKTTLLYYLDDTKTSMGSRKLKQILNNPIIDINKLNYRYDLIQSLFDTKINLNLTNIIEKMYDISRIVSKISFLTASPKDLYFLKNSLVNLPILKETLQKTEVKILLDILNNIPDLSNIYNLIDKSIVDNPPFLLNDGGYIKDKYNSELDKLRKMLSKNDDWVLNYLENQKNITGIKNLKVGYNSIYGHYLEVSNANNSLVKEEYNYKEIARLVNSKRYVTKELNEYSKEVIEAKDKSIKLEEELLNEIRKELKKEIYNIQKVSNVISELDVFLSFARITKKYNYVRPIISNERNLILEKARHPVVERNTKFINNDILLDKDEIIIITGPNMGGKSTFMRTLALNVYLAFIGMYVASSKAIIPIYDKIFTRIGSSDDISGGKSTFMVEMLEANYALTKATDKSLILFDEIGRGTATFDGMALAYSIIKYIATNIKCQTLFSTHYHELTNLSLEYNNIKNYYTKAKVSDNNIKFLYEVVPGKADKSYGVHVASLAGLPEQLIKDASIYLKNIEKQNKLVDFNLFTYEDTKNASEVEVFVKDKELEDKILNIDLNKTTPIDCFIILKNLQEKILEEKNNEED